MLWREMSSAESAPLAVEAVEDPGGDCLGVAPENCSHSVRTGLGISKCPKKRHRKERIKSTFGQLPHPGRGSNTKLHLCLTRETFPCPSYLFFLPFTWLWRGQKWSVQEEAKQNQSWIVRAPPTPWCRFLSLTQTQAPGGEKFDIEWGFETLILDWTGAFKILK